jgi:prepilin-type N-terminal cleavage/methylation domain-containing protein
VNPLLGGRQDGFTMLELMVVIVVAALLLRMAMVNVGAIIPGSQVDAEARKLRAVLHHVRTEAALSGRVHSVELDLDGSRFRTVLPPEEEMAMARWDSPEREPQALPWEALDGSVGLTGVATGAHDVVRSGRVEIAFDAMGYTADTAIFLRHRHQQDLVRTLHLPGLGGQILVVDGGPEGLEVPFPTIQEFDF